MKSHIPIFYLMISSSFVEQWNRKGIIVRMEILETEKLLIRV